VKQPHNRNRLLLATVIASILFLGLVANVLAAPPPPSVHWGTVQVNGANVPAGTTITSFVYADDGVTEIACGSAATQLQGGVSVYSIAVNGDDSEVPGKDGAEDGDTIYFWIGEGQDKLLADETGVWHEADTVNLNLTAGQITPTPTPTTPPNYRALLPLIYKANTGTGQHVLVTFQEDLESYSGTADTYLDGWNTSTNYGDSPHLAVSAYEVRSPALRFDLSLIPQSVHVESARVELYVSDRSIGASLPVSLYRVQRHWSEAGATYLAANGGNWEIAGCSGPSDRDLTPIATTELIKSSWWYSWDITSLARDWVRTPASNAGMLLVGSGEAGQPQVQYTFHSSESSDNQKRPKLTVAYWLSDE